MASPPLPAHIPVAIIGGGQAGLSVSATLAGRGIEHLVLEKHRIAHAWRSQRWDSFCLVTPNWQCKLPGFAYQGDQPYGFMPRDEIVAYVEAFARHIDAPVREGCGVDRLARDGDRFVLETSGGTLTADAVVLAVGGYHRPSIPRIAERLPEKVVQLHSSTYRNPAQLPEGAVLVVGSGQSGCQIAEDLHLAGRRVHLVTGSAPRCPRVYRGRDAVEWLADLGQYDLPVEQHPLREKVRRKANHYLTGRDGGRDIDLRRFAAEGMVLHGRLDDVRGSRLRFRDDLRANLDGADQVYNGICALIDKHISDQDIAAPPGQRYTPVWEPDAPATSLDLEIAGINAVVWATGFAADWSWVELPIFDGQGYPTHHRGVTALASVYTVGLPWLHSWGSGRFVGLARDAEYLAERISLGLGRTMRVQVARVTA
ncbi:MSMEG_0569 family flavin-dependent oxidoreductase [Plastoroseomonas arctica]|uniref:MSMEG_0569 family flavin-dependent oxidoreductase n=1 Tax=Plastoroseomonas arctica TaxID=1509237 RepID=A0AAF1KPZ9_9PROT|nr:MSMEG_0569 family flavin-dependent oxidoreductase [Plastoroseomonas arctica]MBR0656788.1 MSMEG_0569 family flavin-dependent oxidoreductase [Plastoroseomonas arctica]